MPSSKLSDVCDYYAMLSYSTDMAPNFHVETEDFIFVSPEHNLLVPVPDLGTAGDDPCANSYVRTGMWLQTARYREDSLKALIKESNPGILSLLGFLFLEAKVQGCNNTSCCSMKDAMEKTAPQCGWLKFRDWALVAMSCQQCFPIDDGLSMASVHLANLVRGCLRLLDDYRYSAGMFRQHFDDTELQPTKLSEVFDILHWMATIQCSLGINMPLEKWDHEFIPTPVTQKVIEEARDRLAHIKICKARLESFMRLVERGDSDLPAVVEALTGAPSLSHDYDQKHCYCVPSKCQLASMDTTLVEQLHKCTTLREPSCVGRRFDPDLLVPAVEDGRQTAWHHSLTRLARPDETYIAISHVWSDGTGVGVQGRGLVNDCLWKYFTDLLSATGLGSVAIWWDAISIPLDDMARRKAINEMHNNYHQASCTVVHDSYLLDIDGRDPELACLAVVLSPWFARGWTALELAMSRNIKFLFKGPICGKPDIVDLQSILATSPATSSRAHWSASCMIRRLSKGGRPADMMTDLLTILQPRTTTRLRDRPLIAALLGNVAMDYRDNEEQIIRKVILHMGAVPYVSLLHGKPTLCEFGPFSWCPKSLDNMPIDIGTDMNGDMSRPDGARMLKVVMDGALEGVWLTRSLCYRDISESTLRPYESDPETANKIKRALSEWQSCILLRGEPNEKEPLLLVMAFGLVEGENLDPIINCRYIGAVWSSLAHDDAAGYEDENMPEWYSYGVLIGNDASSGGSGTNARDVLLAAEDMNERWQQHREKNPRPKSSISETNSQRQPVGSGLSEDLAVIDTHLIQATNEFKAGAMRHLVRLGARISIDREPELLDRSFLKLKRLGDICMELGHEASGSELHDRATILLFQESSLADMFTETLDSWAEMFFGRNRVDLAIKMYQRVRDECVDNVPGQGYKKRHAMKKLQDIAR